MKAPGCLRTGDDGKESLDMAKHDVVDKATNGAGTGDSGRLEHGEKRAARQTAREARRSRSSAPGAARTDGPESGREQAMSEQEQTDMGGGGATATAVKALA